MPLAVPPESAPVGILIFRQSSQGAETFRDLFEHWRTMRVRNEVVYAQGARIGARICNPQHLVRIHLPLGTEGAADVGDADAHLLGRQIEDGRDGIADAVGILDGGPDRERGAVSVLVLPPGSGRDAALAPGRTVFLQPA